MNTETKTFELAVYLIDGTKLMVHGTVSEAELITVYKCLGAEDSRIKVPTGPKTVQFLPARSVLRIEATGDFS